MVRTIKLEIDVDDHEADDVVFDIREELGQMPGVRRVRHGITSSTRVWNKGELSLHPCSHAQLVRIRRVPEMVIQIMVCTRCYYAEPEDEGQATLDMDTAREEQDWYQRRG